MKNSEFCILIFLRFVDRDSLIREGLSNKAVVEGLNVITVLNVIKS